MSQCTAKSKSTGWRCKAQAISGATVCRVHGGSAPQVRAAARMRLLELVDPALATLARGVRERKGIPTAQEIAAARDILDRAGLQATQKHEHLWDGDISKLTEDQLERMSQYFWGFIDPARRDELRTQVLASEGAVIDVEFVRAPEAKQIEASAEPLEATTEGEDW